MQKTYKRRHAMAYPGKLEGFGTPPRVRTLVNSSNSLTDVWEFPTPAAPAIGDTYDIRVNGVTATVTIGENPTTGVIEYSLNSMTPEPITPPGAPAPPTVADTAQALLNAIQFSDIYQYAVPRLDQLTNTLQLEACTTGEALTVSSTNLTLTNPQVAAISSSIPFGIVVGQRPGDTRGTARIPSDAADAPLGITLQTHAIEKMLVSPGNTNKTRDYKAEYWPDEAMDVLDRTETNEGIWVRSLVPETDLAEGDTVYYSFAPDSGGWVTNVAGANTAVLPHARFRPVQEHGQYLNEPILRVNGEQIALVTINMP